MCYSAKITQDYRSYVRAYGAELSLEDFVRLYWQRRSDPRIKIPKAIDAFFADPRNELERQIRALIDEFNAQQATQLQEELFSQRQRLADAERALMSKTTKKALADKRIATGKIEWAKGKLADLQRTDPQDQDFRIFPGVHAPVIVAERGRRLVKPMRYQCRPAGKPALHDRKFPGTYNARRDNLEGFWKDLFGHSHGILIVEAFYEHVSRPGPDGHPANVVLEFRPNPTQDMPVACLWSRWSAPNEADLLSFAAITDEPPPEVAAAGHDRCVVPIKPEHIDAWLTPQRGDLAAQYAILDDRERPHYEHRLAA